MKKSIVTITIFAFVFLTGSVLTNCGSKKADQEETKQTEGEDHEGHQMDSTATVFACPMHPEEKGKEGDKCSKCGMMLEAMKSADSTATHKH